MQVLQLKNISLPSYVSVLRQAVLQWYGARTISNLQSPHFFKLYRIFVGLMCSVIADCLTDRPLLQLK